MKKLILLFAVLLAFSWQNNLKAQPVDVPEVVHFTAILDMVYDIKVREGADQVAHFRTAADYNNGLVAGTGIGFIDPGTTRVTVEATGNWDIRMAATQNFTDVDLQEIPIENLGVYIEDNTGGLGHQNNIDVIWTCTDPASIQLVTTTEADLIVLGGSVGGDAGDITDNDFMLHWEMGTPDVVLANGLGTIFDQMALGAFGPSATYTTDVNLTLWTNP